MGRPFDVVLWGCTGFTGRLVAEYFAKSIAVRHPGIRWALAGRNKEKLEEIQETSRQQAIESGVSSCEPGILVGSSDNQSSIDSIVGQTKVVLATAGPFIKVGTPIVDACARLGTDYVDINGETPWVRSLIAKYHDVCLANGTRIVPMCGYDSIPSDVGTFYTVQQLQQLYDEPVRRVTCYAAASAGWSGGTINTGITLEKMGLLEEMNDPFVLGGAPAGGPREEDQDVTTAQFDERLQKYTAPFFMAGINTRVVRRSAANLGYGPDFNYTEVLATKSEEVAKKMARGTPPAEKREEMVSKGLLPKPGEGPSAEERANAFFKMTFVGETASGKLLATSVSGGDPGYGETSKMVSEAAVLLANGPTPGKGGIMTPAIAFGAGLVDELHSQGIKFQVEGDLTQRIQQAPESKL